MSTQLQHSGFLEFSVVFWYIRARVCVCVWNRIDIKQIHRHPQQSRGRGSLGPPRETPSCRSVRSRPSSGRWLSSGPGLCSTSKTPVKHAPPPPKILTGELVKPDDNAGPQVKILVNDLQQLLLALVGGAVGEQGDGQWVGHANGIRHLQRAGETFGNLMRDY